MLKMQKKKAEASHAAATAARKSPLRSVSNTIITSMNGTSIPNLDFRYSR